MTRLRPLALIALFFVSITLAGCGGGGTPSEEVVTQKGTTKLYIDNDTGWAGTFSIGGKNFKIGTSGLTLYNMSIGYSYPWKFTADGGWTTRSGSKKISGVSSNYLVLN